MKDSLGVILNLTPLTKLQLFIIFSRLFWKVPEQVLGQARPRRVGRVGRPEGQLEVLQLFPQRQRKQG